MTDIKDILDEGDGEEDSPKGNENWGEPVPIEELQKELDKEYGIYAPKAEDILEEDPQTNMDLEFNVIVSEEAVINDAEAEVPSVKKEQALFDVLTDLDKTANWMKEKATDPKEGQTKLAILQYLIINFTQNKLENSIKAENVKSQLLDIIQKENKALKNG